MLGGGEALAAGMASGGGGSGGDGGYQRRRPTLTPPPPGTSTPLNIKFNITFNVALLATLTPLLKPVGVMYTRILYLLTRYSWPHYHSILKQVNVIYIYHIVSAALLDTFGQLLKTNYHHI